MSIPKQKVLYNNDETARVLLDAPPKGDSPAHRRLIALADDRFRLVSIADQVAGDTLYTRSYKWDIGNKNFPEDIDAHMRFVTKYYPYTKGDDGKPAGVLLVDEPRNEWEVRQAYTRQKLLHRLGIRHIVVEPMRPDPENPGKMLEASTLDHCLYQLDDFRARQHAAKRKEKVT